MQSKQKYKPKKEVKISPEDTIRLVRVATKCADLLTEYDALFYLMESKKSKYIKHKLKEPFVILGESLDRFSSAFLKPFIQEDENTQMDLQKMFRELTNKIWFVNEEMTNLVNFYSKTKSIFNDLSEMKYSDPTLKYIKEVCENFCTEVEKKYKAILNKEDKEGHGVADVVAAYDKLGKLIMYS
jgi:hypothetical protein